MTVTKAAKFETGPGQSQLFNLKDIESEAKAILDDARQQAQHILDEAREQAQQDRQQARTQGHAQGHAQGLENGRQQGHQQALDEARADFQKRTAQFLAANNAVCESFDAAKARLLALAEQQTLALALAVARKVLRRAAVLSHEVAAENVKAALDLLARKTNVVIHVHPDDLEHLEHMDQAGKAWRQYGHVSFVADETITPGGCVLTTDQGRIDGQLDSQIDRIAAELLLGENTDERRLLAEPSTAAEPQNDHPETTQTSETDAGKL
jgi:flagellar assembly protein FliH